MTAKTQYRTGPETERLTHRALTVDDAAELFTVNGHPEVMRYTGETPLASVEAARNAIADYPDFDTFGFGRWGSFLKETGALIGICGLKYLTDLDAVDVGYRFLPEYWGRGLATEGCRASLAFGFDTLGLEQIIGMALPENGASIRVLQKAGMRADGDVLYDDELVVRYVMDRGDVRTTSGGDP